MSRQNRIEQISGALMCVAVWAFCVYVTHASAWATFFVAMIAYVLAAQVVTIILDARLRLRLAWRLRWILGRRRVYRAMPVGTIAIGAGGYYIHTREGWRWDDDRGPFTSWHDVPGDDVTRIVPPFKNRSRVNDAAVN